MQDTKKLAYSWVAATCKYNEHDLSINFSLNKSHKASHKCMTTLLPQHEHLFQPKDVPSLLSLAVRCVISTAGYKLVSPNQSYVAIHVHTHTTYY